MLNFIAEGGDPNTIAIVWQEHRVGTILCFEISGECWLDMECISPSGLMLLDVGNISCGNKTAAKRRATRLWEDFTRRIETDKVFFKQLAGEE